MKINLSASTNFEAGIAIPIDKPYRWTSADVVRKIKNCLKNRGYKKIKIGHAGTLDPLATGILVVCIGKATKQAESIQAQRKEYIAEVCLGATTPCCDMEKEIDATYPIAHITEQMIREALSSFVGEQLQVPPIFSAKLIDGKRAYEYARKGEEVEMRKALITIYDIELLSVEMPKITVKISCSKGTYIRAFARDLGVKLSSGAHLSGLVRSKNGDFTLQECLSVEEVTNIISEATHKDQL
ncbi:MAG: tRNA pseudouridine(55) synthase TruB [Rikenellaceae bacterium]